MPRALAAQRGDDPATARFIDELRAASDEFAQIWDQHDSHRMQPGFESGDAGRASRGEEDGASPMPGCWK
jgi:MmyB-like transcription regulator ligand binding domain